MYMNGRGPMTGGHRGPMGGPGMGPRVRMGYAPGLGFRPMRVYHRPMGFFPLGGLFILPALMFGGWIAVAVLAGVLSLVGSIIGGVFTGLDALAESAFSGNGLVIGIVIGLVAWRHSTSSGTGTQRRKKAPARWTVRKPILRSLNRLPSLTGQTTDINQPE